MKPTARPTATPKPDSIPANHSIAITFRMVIIANLLDTGPIVQFVAQWRKIGQKRIVIIWTRVLRAAFVQVIPADSPFQLDVALVTLCR